MTVKYVDASGNEAPSFDSLDITDIYVCADGCDPTADEPEGGLYECGGCGTTFVRSGSADGGSNRCPDCNKFAAKIADYGCDQCESGEVERVDGFVCPNCDEAVSGDTEEAWNDHVGACYTAVAGE
jgi:DNA-directed RNA polymerase subunit RPC12/RpoP